MHKILHKPAVKILFICLLILFALFAIKLFWEIKSASLHRSYLKLPITEQKVEDWMTFNFLERRYNIEVEKILGKDLSLREGRMRLKTYCVKEKVDCDSLVKEFEKAKNNN